MNKFYLSAAVVAASMALPALPAMAQASEIVIGITVTTTGPAAALGIPERNALEFVPKEIGGVALKVITLDDGGDPTAATTNARRFVTESKADIIMGSSTTPPTVAVSTVANEAGIPHFGLAPFPITPPISFGTNSSALRSGIPSAAAGPVVVTVMPMTISLAWAIAGNAGRASDAATTAADR